MKAKQQTPKWTLKTAKQSSVDELQNLLKVPKVIAQLLIQRGILNFDAARAYFRPNLEDLHDPFLMKDMKRAVISIQTAINNTERIMIYGDYDVDGTTSVALLYSFLIKRYKSITYYTPDRYNEGYGVSIKAIDHARDMGVRLIITLDCGIRDVSAIDYAESLGISVVVCDHHMPGLQKPKAVAILDPKQADCPYPYKELSGCGIGFKLIQALCIYWGLSPRVAYAYLDYVCISIAADIVPITGENRVLAHYGLLLLKKTKRLGIKALLGELKEPSISDIVFKIAPKINAAGRLAHANEAVALLISKDKIEAEGLNMRLCALNTERKAIDEKTTNQAIDMLLKKKQDKATTVVYHPSWNKGIIGIVAARLTEHYYRPTLVFTKNEDHLVASARSVHAFDIYEALSQCADLFLKFGGHKYAAGLSMAKEHLETFQTRFEAIVKAEQEKQAFEKQIQIDAEIHLEELNPRFLRLIKQMEPFGPSNMRPVFLSRNLYAKPCARPIGKDKTHLRFTTHNGNANTSFKTVAFNQAEAYPEIKTHRFDMVYSLEENHWQGISQWQLLARDIRLNSDF